MHTRTHHILIAFSVLTPFEVEVHAASPLLLNASHELDDVKQSPPDQKQTIEKKKKKKKKN
jgi:hypothetical protein